MRFGQVVIGGAGSGKSTYCLGISDLLTQLKRKPCLVNLDCGNGTPPYKADIDIRDLINLEDIAEEYKLGPNGALLFSLEQLLVDFSWLQDKIVKAGKDRYFIFDFPGQIELFTHSNLVMDLVFKMHKELDVQLVALNLVDCLLCIDKFSYVSAALGSLSSAIRLELPFLNVLTKIDLMRTFKSDLAVSLRSALTTCGEGALGSLADTLFPNHAVPSLKHPLDKKFHVMSRAICDLIDEYGLTGFQPLAVEDKQLMLRILVTCDKCNGYSGNRKDAMTLAEELSTEPLEEWFGGLEERYLGDNADACASCGAAEASMRCGRCRKIKYCDQHCQSDHWKRGHRFECRAEETPKP